MKWLDGEDGYDPGNLIIDRFGLSYNFIQANNLSWIEGLTTSTGKDLADPNHPMYRTYKVAEYVARYGKRKCEANALVVVPDAARRLCRDAIEKYLGKDSLQRFKSKRDQPREEIKTYMDQSGLGIRLQQAIDEINHTV